MQRSYTSVPSSPSSSNKGPVTDSVFFFFGFGGGFGGTLASLPCPLGSVAPGGEATKEFLLLAVPGSSSRLFRLAPSGALRAVQLSLCLGSALSGFEDLLDAVTCEAGTAPGAMLMLGVLLLRLPLVPGFALGNAGDG
jgi:hypothetical protein